MDAQQIFIDLIKRIKASVLKKERIVFDPETGIQKCFLDGKLIWVKSVADPRPILKLKKSTE